MPAPASLPPLCRIPQRHCPPVFVSAQYACTRMPEELVRHDWCFHPQSLQDEVEQLPPTSITCADTKTSSQTMTRAAKSTAAETPSHTHWDTWAGSELHQTTLRRVVIGAVPRPAPMHNPIQKKEGVMATRPHHDDQVVSPR